MFRILSNYEMLFLFFPLFSSGAIGARLSANASNVRSLVGDFLALVVQNTSTVIAAVIISFVANWKLAFIILLTIPLVGCQGYLQAKFLQGFSANAKVSALCYMHFISFLNTLIGLAYLQLVFII